MTVISLLINDSAYEDHVDKLIRFGGRPAAPSGILEWPTCASCQGNMQFLGQLPAGAQDGAARGLVEAIPTDQRDGTGAGRERGEDPQVLPAHQQERASQAAQGAHR